MLKSSKFFTNPRNMLLGITHYLVKLMYVTSVLNIWLEHDLQVAKQCFEAKLRLISILLKQVDKQSFWFDNYTCSLLHKFRNKKYTSYLNSTILYYEPLLFRCRPQPKLFVSCPFVTTQVLYFPTPRDPCYSFNFFSHFLIIKHSKLFDFRRSYSRVFAM